MDADEAGLMGEARGGWPCPQEAGVPADVVVRRARPLLGTFVEIAVTGASPDQMEAAVDTAFEAVETVHRLMSFHEEGSDVSRLNREASSDSMTVHPWTFEVLAAALDLYRRSDGVFDVAVAPVLQDLGVLPRRDEMPLMRPTGGLGEPIVLLPDGRVGFRDRGVRIDLGGIAKGYAVDRAVAVLRDRGIVQGIVNAGGDLAVFGALAEMIQIRDPRDPARAMCVVEVANAALATSGSRFDPVAARAPTASAVIDPRTGAPASLLGATVRAPTCMLADALTKIVMATGEAAAPLLASYGASALFVSEHGVHVTADWQDGVRLAA
jgi:thiamine biosynthesis lipoprotein